MLFGKRGKSGLVALNLDFDQVKEFVKERLGVEVVQLQFFPLLPWRKHLTFKDLMNWTALALLVLFRLRWVAARLQSRPSLLSHLFPTIKSITYQLCQRGLAALSASRSVEELRLRRIGTRLKQFFFRLRSQWHRMPVLPWLPPFHWRYFICTMTCLLTLCGWSHICIL